MTASAGGGARTRRFAAIGLVVLNAGLLGLNLDKHGALPISTGLWASGEENATRAASAPESTSDPAEESPGEGTAENRASNDPAAADTTVDGAGAENLSANGVTTDISVDSVVGEEQESVDDWPGGRGLAPEGPPPPRIATIEPDGRLILTGSAPDWATATRITEVAAANLPAGMEGVSNELTWHPTAPADIRSGDVRIDRAATFGVGSAVINPESTATLDLAAEMLQSRPSLFLVVIGHTDDVGEEAVNAQLALERANVVVEYLIGAGVVGGQIVVASAGEDDPTASNLTEEGRDANRRIEFLFKNFFIPPQDFGLPG